MEKKKKILVFIPEFPRISETFIERDLSKLIDLGNLDITIFSLSRASGSMSKNVEEVVTYERITPLVALAAFFSFVLLHPIKILRIKLFVLLKNDSVPRLVSFKKRKNDLRSELSVLGRFQNSRTVHFFKGIAYAKLMQKYTPDEIHAHFLSAESNIAMVAAMVLGVPFSISAHAKDVLVEPSLAEIKAKQAKFITVCNKNAYMTCVSLAGSNKESVYLSYHGLDPKKLYGSAPTIQKPDRLLIFPGGTRLVEKKGLRYLIKASRLLLDKGIDHQIDLVGPESEVEPGKLNEFKELAEEIGVSDNIVFHGKGKGTPNEIVLQYYQIADIFCLPAITAGSGDADGIPNTVIEAALARLPIITTDAGSISELIDHNKNGLIIEQENPQEIADNVEYLVNNKEVSQRLGDAAYERAVAMFNQEKNVKELERLLLME